MSAMTETESGLRLGETLSQRLAQFAAGFGLEQVPADVVAYAKLCMADAIGIGFASHSYAFARRSIDAVAGLAGPGDFAVIGTGIGLPARDAALLNGILIHGLDFDDTHSGAVIHASTSAVPLVLSEATRHGTSGSRGLAAFILALEADARIGKLANGMFQKIGFHPTGMVGIFGCTLAAAYLGGLTEEQTARAQGIALSMASGSLEFLEDGSWTKRMHPGWAASSAITAAALAAGGFKGPLKAYEGRYGLYNLYLREQPGGLRHALDDLGSDWEVLRVAIKPYPVCHFNHACIDAMLALRAAHGLEPADIASVTALIHEKQQDVVCRPEAQKRRPQNDYEGKFSLHFAIAAAAVRGRFTLAELEDSALSDPEILAVCDRTSFRHYPESHYPEFYSGGVIVKTTDGRTLEHREPVNRGAESRALDARDVRAKFDENVTRKLGASSARRVWDAVMNLEHADGLAELNAALAAVE